MTDDKFTDALRPINSIDTIIALYKKDVDMGMIRHNLRLTPAERMDQFVRTMAGIYELKRAGERLRQQQRQNHD